MKHTQKKSKREETEIGRTFGGFLVPGSSSGRLAVVLDPRFYEIDLYP